MTDLLAIAKQTLWEACALVPPVSGTVHNKSARDYDPVTATDLAINQHVLGRLRAVCSDSVGYVSEESQTLEDRLAHNQVWILDPLDGTREFIEGRWEFAIHLALVEAQRPQVAVVALPRLKTLFWAVQGQGAYVETLDQGPQRLHVQAQAETLRICVSRSHRGAEVDAVLQALPTTATVPLGGLGCKLVAIASQRPPLPAVDAYVGVALKSAPKDWDLAAPDLILTEAGGKLTNFAAEPLRYNRADWHHWGGIFASNRSDHHDLCAQASGTLPR